jgi:hypothetical protein
MRSSTFTTWLGQLLAGIALIAGGADVVWVFGVDWYGLALAGLMAVALGVVILMRAEARERPLRLLRMARRSLDLPSPWTVEFGKELPDGGSAAIMATRSDCARFVIDICGYKEVNSTKEVTSKERGLLVGPNGKYLKPDPMPALSKAATALGGTAVLWLPNASTNRNLRMPASNLIVVMGNARHLKHVLLGAEVAVARQEQPQVLVERRTKPRTAVSEPAHADAQ